MDKSKADVLCGLHGFGSSCILRQWRRKFFHITTTFFQPMQISDFESYISMAIKAELVSQCKQLPSADQPFSPNNPGDDPHFHKVVKSIKQDIILAIAEHCEEALSPE